MPVVKVAKESPKRTVPSLDDKTLGFYLENWKKELKGELGTKDGHLNTSRRLTSKLAKSFELDLIV